MAVDVVGYSRLMGRDESGTLTSLREHRKQRFEPALARYGGRLVKLSGDGALVEFASAVDALGAAIEFQQAMVEANRDQPADTALVFRMGLHVGDLIVDGDDLYGDGVNIAARLETEAPPGGIIVSRAVREAVDGRLKAKLHALGELALKNIERPIRAFRVEWSEADWQGASTSPARHSGPDAPTLALPDKPSIAVLPFQNMSGDPEQEYFADGMVEDIITALSRFKSLFVIARNSSFAYKGRSPDIRQVGQELGVRYVLEGSLRKAANRIRVSGQLIDTLNGRHLWAERYDRVLQDVFAVQEEITLAIVAAIAPQIEAVERTLAMRRRPENLSAYEISLRARAHALEALGKGDRELIEQAILEAEQALEIDPNSVQALQSLAMAYGQMLLLRMEREGALRHATQAATRAIELDPTDAFSYTLRSLAILRGRQYDRYSDALADVRRAHLMNPNDVETLRVVAALETAIGDADQAIERVKLALRLSPRDPLEPIAFGLLAFACFGARRYAEGADWASRALENRPRMIQIQDIYAGCLVGMGEIGRARVVFDRLRKDAPDYAQQSLEGASLFARPEDRLRVGTFLRIAAGLDDASAAEAVR